MSEFEVDLDQVDDAFFTSAASFLGGDDEFNFHHSHHNGFSSYVPPPPPPPPMPMCYQQQQLPEFAQSAPLTTTSGASSPAAESITSCSSAGGETASPSSSPHAASSMMSGVSMFQLPPPQLPPMPASYFQPLQQQLDWSAHSDPRARAAYLMQQQAPAATVAALGGDVSMISAMPTECKMRARARAAPTVVKTETGSAAPMRRKRGISETDKLEEARRFLQNGTPTTFASEEEERQYKKQRRVMKNRLSAHDSRESKNHRLEELEAENADLRSRVAELEMELARYRSPVSAAGVMMVVLLACALVFQAAQPGLSVSSAVPSTTSSPFVYSTPGPALPMESAASSSSRVAVLESLHDDAMVPLDMQQRTRPGRVLMSVPSAAAAPTSAASGITLPTPPSPATAAAQAFEADIVPALALSPAMPPSPVAPPSPEFAALLRGSPMDMEDAAAAGAEFNHHAVIDEDGLEAVLENVMRQLLSLPLFKPGMLERTANLMQHRFHMPYELASAIVNAFSTHVPVQASLSNAALGGVLPSPQLLDGTSKAYLYTPMAYTMLPVNKSASGVTLSIDTTEVVLSMLVPVPHIENALNSVAPELGFKVDPGAVLGPSSAEFMEIKFVAPVMAAAAVSHNSAVAAAGGGGAQAPPAVLA